VALALRAAPHNYTDQLERGPAAAVPHYVRRAEEFMQAHCADPLRIADVAAAAGCSVRTLGDVFRRFRGRTPLAALHAIRLEQVHATLSLRATRDDGAAVGAIARRYGFANPSRFVAAFRRRFGEAPLDVLRRTSRSDGFQRAYPNVSCCPVEQNTWPVRLTPSEMARGSNPGALPPGSIATSAAPRR
jgi:AraC-like DNA-binding protein